MNNINYVGKFVTLKEDFILRGQAIDCNFPTKVKRPYLIVEIPTKQGNKLFAVPMQSSIPNLKKNNLYTRFVRRLEAWPGYESGLVYFQMIPVTAKQIESAKHSEILVPSDIKKQGAVLHNLKTLDIQMVPEKARTAFISLRSMANNTNDVFGNLIFRNQYGKVADEIFQETIRIKDKNLETITKKAENYLLTYMKFVQQNVHKKLSGNEKRIKLPKFHTRLDKLFKFLEDYNADQIEQKKESNQANVKTSLQPDLLIEKYKLTQEQFTAAETLAAKDKQDLEKIIRKNIAFAPDGEFDADVKARILAEQAKERAGQQKQPKPKTQEKNIAKPEPKKRSVNAK